MKSFSLILILIYSVSSFGASEELVLNAKQIDLGSLEQVGNKAVNSSIVVVRNAESPNTVKLNYKFNYMETACVNYELEYTDVAAIEQIVCTPTGAETICEEKENETTCVAPGEATYDCQKMKYEAYRIPKRVCVEKGLIQKERLDSVKLKFNRSIVLSKGSTERFEINLKQRGVKKDKLRVSGKVLESASVYKVKTTWLGHGRTIKFKAER